MISDSSTRSIVTALKKNKIAGGTKHELSFAGALIKVVYSHTETSKRCVSRTLGFKTYLNGTGQIINPGMIIEIWMGSCLSQLSRTSYDQT